MLRLTKDQCKQRRREFEKVRRRRTAELLAQSDGYCHYCHRPFNDPKCPGASKPAVDHIVPVLWGGNDELANLVLACMNCNSLKKDLPYEEFTRRIEMYKTMEYFGEDYRRWADEYEQRRFSLGIASQYKELSSQ